MEKQEYSMYEIITMTPGMAWEVLCYEIKKQCPDMELIENILKHSNIDVNQKNSDGSTALIRASDWGHTEVVRLLLEHPEIRVNVQDKDGNTAIIWALTWRHTEIVQLLKEHSK